MPKSKGYDITKDAKNSDVSINKPIGSASDFIKLSNEERAKYHRIKDSNLDIRF